MIAWRVEGELSARGNLVTSGENCGHADTDRIEQVRIGVARE
jgi:hypothetical protein